ncbi:septal ring lytic transglycosylase RlpA family protein [Hyphomicrobium sp.]|uniref:septal ring lytic transglycosylase RlpA family protein n=1 Tax=Hyphomicrobium sp. TaxID=82 RepID=UPI002E328734|nr:septal ring lytic transglycosylase RlpA family protein [Hyphomicrobium sp.]HEX2842448.1 septal ring lytic transglycosylase RlpA family protein [Hyphomicrobium sp.]
MRFFAFAALALMAVGLIDARPASAAGWQCSGPEVACGGASHAKKATYKKAASHRNHKANRYAKTAKRSSSHAASSGSYGGGSNGMASYYWQGQMTASGARFNPSGMTAAHRTLPFGTKVLVTNRNNGRSVTVTINDRGPFIKGRIIDLSSGAAGVIGMKGSGVAPVSITVLGRG